MENQHPDAGDGGESYFEEIEAHFGRRRGTSFVFSSKDWALMKGWHEQGVPLAIVLEAIDSCFDKREQSGRRRESISSLSYCRHAVLDLWDERKDQFVGHEGSVPEADPVAALTTLEAAIRECAEGGDAAVRPVFDATIAEIALLERSAQTVPQVEEALVVIEDRLIARLLAAMPAESRDALVASVERELARYAMPDEDTRAKTRDANLRRQVRKAFSVPRLSLFG